MLKILVTGAAGFIGMHVVRRLLERDDAVTGIDNLNDYYGPRLKEARLAMTNSTGIDVEMELPEQTRKGETNGATYIFWRRR